MNGRPPRPDPAEIEAAILQLAAAARTIDPAQPARLLAGAAEWRALLPLVRAAAVRLAAAGRLIIYRKGKPVDPGDFRGVYRLGLAPAESRDQGAGNSAEDRPLR